MQRSIRELQQVEQPSHGYVDFLRNCVSPGTSPASVYLTKDDPVPAASLCLHNGFGIRDT